MAEIRFGHCVIAVSDRERANAFYRDVLGAELVQRARCARETATCASSGISYE